MGTGKCGAGCQLPLAPSVMSDRVSDGLRVNSARNVRQQINLTYVSVVCALEQLVCLESSYRKRTQDKRARVYVTVLLLMGLACS